MAEDFDDDDDEVTEQPQEKVVQVPRSVIRDLEKKAKALAELQPRFTALERKEVIRSAGLTELNARQIKALEAAHEGDFDTDNLRATAAELGFIKPEPEVPDEEIAAHQRMANASAGARAEPNFNHDAAVAKAETVEEIVAASQAAGFPTTWDGV